MNHKDLDAWKEAMELAESVYQLTRGFPKEEVYGLTSQVRRSVVSVPSNLSEGAARPSRKEFVTWILHRLVQNPLCDSSLGVCSRKDVTFCG